MTAISLDTIGSTLAARLKVSAALLAASETYFPGDLYTIYYGATGDLSPDDQPFPTFLITPSSKHTPIMAEKKQYSFDIAIEILQAKPTITVTGGAPTIVDYAGAGIIEEFSDLILLEIKAMSSALSIEEATLIIETSLFFPVATGILSVTVTLPNVLGGYTPAL